ncbi:MAG: hypothetical protein FE78DRAFT_73118 [Acidomyces sp. 'richmondensis']|nr:MAG: hypothetical protein FE78DRAFT_73118 [Acidomyces sp. 'richmondensis']
MAGWPDGRMTEREGVREWRRGERGGDGGGGKEGAARESLAAACRRRTAWAAAQRLCRGRLGSKAISAVSRARARTTRGRICAPWHSGRSLAGWMRMSDLAGGAFDYTDRPSIFALQWSPPQPTPTTTLTYFAHGEVNGGAFEVGTPSMRSPTSPRATASMSSEGSLGELEFGDFLATGGLRPGHRRKGLSPSAVGLPGIARSISPTLHIISIRRPSGLQASVQAQQTSSS